MRELMGATVEAGPMGGGPSAPVYDGPVLGDRCHLTADASRAVLTVEGLARFAVEDGRRIRVERERGARSATVTAWLHGTVAALLLAQRGRFALHASMAAVDGLGVALAGRRRAGKSTTALRLSQRGHTLVTDDVTPLEVGETVTAHPFARDVHVHAATADELGLDVTAAARPRAGPAKLSLPGPGGPAVAVGAVVALAPREDAGVAAERVTGAPAHRVVLVNTYRGAILRNVWEAELFAWAGTIAARVPVFRLTRPADGWTVDSVAETVEAIAGGLHARAA